MCPIDVIETPVKEVNVVSGIENSKVGGTFVINVDISMKNLPQAFKNMIVNEVKTITYGVR